MELNQKADAVTSREDFVAFVKALKSDFASNPEQWQNLTVSDFLDGLSAWVENMDCYYQNQRLSVPAAPSWKTLAEMLLAAKYYEYFASCLRIEVGG